jgi:hypothetical protein
VGPGDRVALGGLIAADVHRIRVIMLDAYVSRLAVESPNWFAQTCTV